VLRSVVVRKDEDALHELIDGTLQTTRPDGSTEERVVAPRELGRTLEEQFGLTLRPDEIARIASRE
jgi:hypothetical protein